MEKLSECVGPVVISSLSQNNIVCSSGRSLQYLLEGEEMASYLVSAINTLSDRAECWTV